MRINNLFFILLFTIPQLSAQVLSSDSTAPKKFTYLAGIGISSQYTTDLVSHFRAEVKYQFSPKTKFIATLSYTPKSIGDTFAVYSIEYFNDGDIIGNEYTRSAVTRFSMVDFGISVSQNIHPKIALRAGPSISRLVNTEHISDVGFVGQSFARSSRGSKDQSVSNFDGVRSTLWGADFGVDLSLYKRFSLNYTSALRFTDVTIDDTYGPYTNRIMKHNLSLNYTIR